MSYVHPYDAYEEDMACFLDDDVRERFSGEVIPYDPSEDMEDEEEA